MRDKNRCSEGWSHNFLQWTEPTEEYDKWGSTGYAVQQRVCSKCHLREQRQVGHLLAPSNFLGLSH